MFKPMEKKKAHFTHKKFAKDATYSVLAEAYYKPLVLVIWIGGERISAKQISLKKKN